MKEKTDNIDILEEKEKKAIKDLKELSHYCSLRAIDIDDKYSDLWARYVVSIQIVKNLIETLISENKELKEMLKNRIEYTNKLEKDLFQNASNYVIPKSKVEEVIKEIQEERKIAYKNFMNKKLEEDFEKDGAILQELGYIEGKLQSLLGKE